MSAQPTTADRTDAALSQALADVKGEIARTDSKSSLLIAFDGALLAGLTAATPKLSPTIPTVLLGGAGFILLLAAAGMLLSVIRPRLRPAAPGSFPHLATLTADQVREVLAVDRRADNIAVLSRLAKAKFERLQRAVDCTRLAGVLLVAAAVVAGIGGAA